MPTAVEKMAGCLPDDLTTGELSWAIAQQEHRIVEHPVIIFCKSPFNFMVMKFTKNQGNALLPFNI